MLNAKVTRKELIKKYPEKLNKVNDEFLPSAGVIVQGAAKRNAPIISGRLRGSISYHTSDGDKSGVDDPAKASDAVSKPGEDSVAIGTSVFYAPYVEYGTSRSKAKSYLRTAIDANRKNLVKLWKEIFGRVYG